MKNQIYISYSHQDRSIADRIIEQLDQLGVPTWSDREIKAGSNWQKEIDRAFDESDTVVFLLSPNSVSSPFSQNELDEALAKGKKILPVLIRDVDPAAVPQALHSYHWIDLRHGDEQVLKSIAASTGRASETTPIKTTRKNKGYVFISYAEEDSDFVGGLKGFLKEKGYGYWDYEESDRDYHSQLFLELEEVILGATALFAILSEKWKRSNWTVREYFFAEEAKVPIFLLRAKQIGPTLAIAGIPYIDFTIDPASGFEKLNRELKRKGL